MNQGSPPISGKTRFYGMFGDPVEHLRAQTALNELMNSRGVDAVLLPLHVAPEHPAEAISGIRVNGGVIMSHKGGGNGRCGRLKSVPPKAFT